jgi:hypothetical protein
MAKYRNGPKKEETKKDDSYPTADPQNNYYHV